MLKGGRFNSERSHDQATYKTLYWGFFLLWTASFICLLVAFPVAIAIAGVTLILQLIELTYTLPNKCSVKKIRDIVEVCQDHGNMRNLELIPKGEAYHGGFLNSHFSGERGMPHTQDNYRSITKSIGNVAR